MRGNGAAAGLGGGLGGGGGGVPFVLVFQNEVEDVGDRQTQTSRRRFVEQAYASLFPDCAPHLGPPPPPRRP